MKRTFIWSCIGFGILVAGAGVIWAEAHSWHGFCRHHRMFGPAAYFSRQLGLDASQQSKIKAIWQTERPQAASALREIAVGERNLRAMRNSAGHDDSRIQEITTRETAAITKLLLIKEQVETEIYSSVLTPEQRQKADKLQQQCADKLDSFAARLEK